MTYKQKAGHTQHTDFVIESQTTLFQPFHQFIQSFVMFNLITSCRNKIIWYVVYSLTVLKIVTDDVIKHLSSRWYTTYEPFFISTDHHRVAKSVISLRSGVSSIWW